MFNEFTVVRTQSLFYQVDGFRSLEMRNLSLERYLNKEEPRLSFHGDFLSIGSARVPSLLPDYQFF